MTMHYLLGYIVYLLIAAPLLIWWGVTMDRRPEKLLGLANFPMKGMPATNGIIFGIVLVALFVLAGWIFFVATS
jgi:hypothetical protein